MFLPPRTFQEFITHKGWSSITEVPQLRRPCFYYISVVLTHITVFYMVFQHLERNRPFCYCETIESVRNHCWSIMTSHPNFCLLPSPGIHGVFSINISKSLCRKEIQVQIMEEKVTKKRRVKRNRGDSCKRDACKWMQWHVLRLSANPILGWPGVCSGADTAFIACYGAVKFVPLLILPWTALSTTSLQWRSVHLHHCRVTYGSGSLDPLHNWSIGFGCLLHLEIGHTKSKSMLRLVNHRCGMEQDTASFLYALFRSGCHEWSHEVLQECSVLTIILSTSFEWLLGTLIKFCLARRCVAWLKLSLS